MPWHTRRSTFELPARYEPQRVRADFGHIFRPASKWRYEDVEPRHARQCTPSRPIADTHFGIEADTLMAVTLAENCGQYLEFLYALLPVCPYFETAEHV